MIHTLRHMTEAEKEEKENVDLKGVRTYFFGAHHYRGLPEMSFDNTQHEDAMWVPKRLLNEYFTKDYHDVFIHALVTR